MSYSQSPYGRFLRAQDPRERGIAAPQSLPTCVYNNSSCGAPCGIKPNGRPYRMCTDHRIRHNQYQRRYVQSRSALRAQLYATIDIEDALDELETRYVLDALSTADEMTDDFALWSNERLFGALAATLDMPSPFVETSGTTELVTMYAEPSAAVVDQEFELDEGEALDIVDLILDEVEPPTDN